MRYKLFIGVSMYTLISGCAIAWAQEGRPIVVDTTFNVSIMDFIKYAMMMTPLALSVFGIMRKLTMVVESASKIDSILLRITDLEKKIVEFDIRAKIEHERRAEWASIQAHTHSDL